LKGLRDNMWRNLYFVLAGTLIIVSMLSFPVQAADRLQSTGEKIVIVIDPGHGGENRGTIENNHEEKLMTMITAQAMYDELCLYDNVEVYLTRTGDVEMYLADRAEFAKEKNADFMFSVHYNASASHELFGSEVWVSAFAPYNGYGYQFGYELLTAMREKGLFIRGVKTRMDDKGRDYYGIIREAAERDIPAVIIEHCHVDEERDEVYCATEEQLQAFGRTDAEAVAKYFGLKSSILQVDYSSYPLADVSANPVPITAIDDSEPDICQIEVSEERYEKGVLSLKVTAADYDSPLLYYSYSLDGGKSFSRRELWPGCDTLAGTYTDSFPLDLQIPAGTTPSVILRAYNLYDLYLDSNCYLSKRIYTDKSTAQASDSGLQETGPGASGGQEGQNGQPGSGEASDGLSGENAQDGSAGLTDALGADKNQTDTAKANQTQADRTEALSDKAGTAQTLSDSANTKKEVSLFTFLIICMIVVIALFFLLLVSQLIANHRKRKRRRYRRNVAGERRNHPR